MYGGYAESTIGSIYVSNALQVVMRKSGNHRWANVNGQGMHDPGARAGVALFADSAHGGVVSVYSFTSQHAAFTRTFCKKYVVY